MRRPDVELLWWQGCPSTQRALRELRTALQDLDLTTAAIRMREIRSDAEAEQTGFPGSPTILIDGVDVCAEDAEDQLGTPASLTCRVYRRRDGRISPTPDADDLRDALRRAAARAEET